MNIHGKDYEFTMASDVGRDGMALECSQIGAAQGPVLEAFWHDPTGRFTFSAFEPDLPFELLEEFVRVARRRLPLSTD
jgi:hypothetical protein